MNPPPEFIEELIADAYNELIASMENLVGMCRQDGMSNEEIVELVRRRLPPGHSAVSRLQTALDMGVV